MASRIKTNAEKYIVCPFCSLHCDDILSKSDGKKYSISSEASKVSEANKTCLKKIESFNINAKSILTPTIKNKKANLSSALKYTRQILKKQKDAIIVNHGIDVSGVRSMLNFALNYNCSIDHINSKFLYQNIGIVQRTGYMATSLTETKNRGDVIIVFGNNILCKTPRLIEKVLIPSNSLCTNAKNKKIIFIGEFPDKLLKNLSKKYNISYIKTKIDYIPDLLNLLSDIGSIKIPNISKALVTKIKSIISKSKYLVATWSASDFINSKNPDKIIQAISQFILDRNKISRAACMPISGSLGDTTSSQTLTWLTGFPSRIKYAHGSFVHDRNIYNNEIIIDKKSTDVVIHISSLSPNKIKINENLKNIFIGHPNSKFTSQPDVFIPVGIPGIDYEGIMFRTDNVVSLALKKIRAINLPTTKEILDELA